MRISSACVAFPTSILRQKGHMDLALVDSLFFWREGYFKLHQNRVNICDGELLLLLALVHASNVRRRKVACESSSRTSCADNPTAGRAKW